MTEAEIKAKVDPVFAEERLLSSGFIFVSSCTEEDIYLNSRFRDFAKTDEALRIRKHVEDSTETVFLTYKGPKLDSVSQTRNETEFGISSAREALGFFGCLGFAPVFTVRKERRTYKRGDVTAVLDKVENLGDYLELEILTGGNPDDAVRRLYSVLSELGTDVKSLTRESYLQLLLQTP